MFDWQLGKQFVTMISWMTHLSVPGGWGQQWAGLVFLHEEKVCPFWFLGWLSWALPGSLGWASSASLIIQHEEKVCHNNFLEDRHRPRGCASSVVPAVSWPNLSGFPLLKFRKIALWITGLLKLRGENVVIMIFWGHVGRVGIFGVLGLQWAGSIFELCSPSWFVWKRLWKPSWFSVLDSSIGYPSSICERLHLGQLELRGTASWFVFQSFCYDSPTWVIPGVLGLQWAGKLRPNRSAWVSHSCENCISDNWNWDDSRLRHNGFPCLV